jgi:hypothetical protein
MHFLFQEKEKIRIRRRFFYYDLSRRKNSKSSQGSVASGVFAWEAFSGEFAREEGGFSDPISL